MTQTCKDCKYRNGDECRRYPPMIIKDEANVFPSVYPNEDWCGEFVKKDEEKEDEINK